MELVDASGSNSAYAFVCALLAPPGFSAHRTPSYIASGMAPKQKPVADIEAAEVRRILKSTQTLFSTVEQWPTLGTTLKKSPEAVNYLMSHDKDARKVARAFLTVVSAVLSLEAVLREVAVPGAGAGAPEAPEPEEESWPVAQPAAAGKKAKAKGSAKSKSEDWTGPKAGNFFAAK